MEPIMSKKTDDMLKKYLKETQFVHLATYDGEFPRVRPITLIWLDEEMLFSTGTEDNKVCQLKKNKNIELCYDLKDEKNAGYLRISGSITFVRSKAVRKNVFEKIGFIRMFFKTPEDKGFCLLKLKPAQIEFIKPGDHLATKFKV
jgi:uncharacterized pyridoxamine 5'-phosphate oxidase family protein